MIAGRCAHCPVTADHRCRGQVIRRFCEHMDPASDAHDPRYGPIIVESSTRRYGHPSLAAQAGNAVKALGQAVASGFARVDQAEFDRRRGICEGCEYFDAAKDRCCKCGCKLAIKPWLVRWHCPIDRW